MLSVDMTFLRSSDFLPFLVILMGIFMNKAIFLDWHFNSYSNPQYQLEISLSFVQFINITTNLSLSQYACVDFVRTKIHVLLA